MAYTDLNPIEERALVRRLNYSEVSRFSKSMNALDRFNRGQMKAFSYAAVPMLGASGMALKVVGNRFGGAAILPAAMTMFDSSKDTREKMVSGFSAGTGYLGAQIGMDVVGGAAAMIGRRLTPTSRASAVHTEVMERMAGGKVLKPLTAIRGRTGSLVASKALKSLGGAMIAIGIAGMLAPEGSALAEASDYLMGQKTTEWIEKQVNKNWLRSRGGFSGSTVMNNVRSNQAREMARALIGQSASNMLGKESQFMHN
jgi:hypothetical protein